MTNFESLLIIFAVQQFRQAGHPKDGPYYGPGYFRNPKLNLIGGLTTESRRASLRLARRFTCIACAAPVSEDGIGDHIIPQSWGGPNRVDNYLPFCTSCNSAKGPRDLFQWWPETGKSAAVLIDDVLCVYSRIWFQFLGDDGLMAQAPEYRDRAARELLDFLPTGAHRSALLNRARTDAAQFFSQRVSA